MRKWFYTEFEYERWTTTWFWVVIAIGLLVAATLNPTTGSIEYQNCRSEAENIYKLRIESLPSTLSYKKNQPNQKTKVDYDQEYLENKATCNDLKAQWAMAIVTYIAFCIGFVGILLVYRTLNATRETIKVTRETANKQIEAAKLANKESSEIGQKQVRAYLSINSAKVDLSQTRPKLEITLRNSGNSPASKVKIFKVSILITAETSARKTIFSAETGGFAHSVNEVMSESNNQSAVIEFPVGIVPEYFCDVGEIIELYMDDRIVNASIECVGKIYYIDVFGEKHLKGFSFKSKNITLSERAVILQRDIAILPTFVEQFERSILDYRPPNHEE